MYRVNGFALVVAFAGFSFGCGSSQSSRSEETGQGQKTLTDHGDQVAENGAPDVDIVADFAAMKNPARRIKVDASGKTLSIATYTYDDIGQELTEKEVDGAGKEISSSTTTYNQAHREVTRHRSNTTSTRVTDYDYTYEYDSGGRLVKETSTNSSGGSSVDTYTYDSSGRTVRMESNSTGSYPTSSVTLVNWDEKTVIHDYKTATNTTHTQSSYSDLVQLDRYGYLISAGLIHEEETVTSSAGQVVSVEKTDCTRVDNIVSCTSTVVDGNGKDMGGEEKRLAVSSMTLINAPTGFENVWNGAKLDFTLSSRRTRMDAAGKKTISTSAYRYNKVGRDVENISTYSNEAYPGSDSNDRSISTFDGTGLNEQRTERYSKGALKETITFEY